MVDGMPITTREAQQLSTAGEWTLVKASQADNIRELTPARLKAKIGRARTLRNKYRDLAKRQHRKAQPRRTGRPYEALNARTGRKAELFEQVLARFEKELARQSETKAAAPTAGKRKKARKTRTTARATKASRRQQSSRASNVPKSAVRTRSGQHRIHAHLSGAGRRRQVRRDTRGR
jgi:hypothetical protein